MNIERGVIRVREGLGLYGAYKFYLINPDGTHKIIYESIPNLVMNAGKVALATMLASLLAGTWDYTWMAIGNSNTDPADATRTTLIGEDCTRVNGTKGSALNVWTLTGTFGAANPPAGLTVREIGIFDAAAAGNMFSRTVVPDITKAPAAALGVQYSLTIG